MLFQNAMWLIFPTGTRKWAIQMMLNYYLFSTINLFYKTLNFETLYKTTVPFNVCVDKVHLRCLSVFLYIIFIYNSRPPLFFKDSGTPNYKLIFTSLLEISFWQQFKYTWDQKYCHLGIPLRECRIKDELIVTSNCPAPELLYFYNK